MEFFIVRNKQCLKKSYLVKNLTNQIIRKSNEIKS